MTNRHLLKAMLLVGVAGAASPALAQSTTAPAQAGATDPSVETASTDAGEVGDIVVTAERRAENLQRVPLSVAVVGGSDLRAFQSGGEDTLALDRKSVV